MIFLLCHYIVTYTLDIPRYMKGFQVTYYILFWRNAYYNIYMGIYIYTLCTELKSNHFILSFGVESRNWFLSSELMVREKNVDEVLPEEVPLACFFSIPAKKYIVCDNCNF